MLTMLSYEWLPYWLNVHTTGDFILVVFAFLLLSFIYVLLGGGLFCPDRVNNRFVRLMIILFWPVYVALVIVTLPLQLALSFSKTKEEQDKELDEWLKSVNENRKKEDERDNEWIDSMR